MMNDTEIQSRGMKLLSELMGLVEAERFVALVQRDSFDYTQWRENNLPSGTVAEVSAAAMAEWNRNQEKGL